MSDVCLLCPNCGRYWHHGTGRDADDAYLDPSLTARVCWSCHPLLHEDWNTAGVGDRETPATFLDSLLLRLRRTALLLGRLAPTAPGPIGTFLTRLAEAMAVWAVGLETALATLDATFPAWRTTPDL